MQVINQLWRSWNFVHRNNPSQWAEFSSRGSLVGVVMIEIDHKTVLRLNKGGEKNPYEAETLQSVTLSKHVDVIGFFYLFIYF